MNLVKSITGDIFVKEKFLSISYSYNMNNNLIEIKVELTDAKGFSRFVNSKSKALAYIDDIESQLYNKPRKFNNCQCLYCNSKYNFHDGNCPNCGANKYKNIE